jgi:hypothetical protein
VPEQRLQKQLLGWIVEREGEYPGGVPDHLLIDRLEVELGPHPENYNMYIDVAVQLVNRGFAENPSGGSDYGTLRATDRGRRMVRGY